MQNLKGLLVQQLNCLYFIKNKELNCVNRIFENDLLPPRGIKENFPTKWHLSRALKDSWVSVSVCGSECIPCGDRILQSKRHRSKKKKKKCKPQTGSRKQHPASWERGIQVEEQQEIKEKGRVRGWLVEGFGFCIYFKPCKIFFLLFYCLHS